MEGHYFFDWAKPAGPSHDHLLGLLSLNEDCT
jgi:hypothetical protein